MKKTISWLFAGLLCVLAAELSLQLAAMLLATDGRDNLPGSKEDFRVVALGDSNTFGLYLDAEETWPAQFEQLWNQYAQTQDTVQPLEVINLGVPGTNSSRLLKNYQQILETFKPDMAMVMIGFNDWWTPNESWQPGKKSVLEKLQEKSRLYRFYQLLKADKVDPQKVEVMERVESLGGLSTQEIIEKVEKHLKEKPVDNDPEKARLSTRVRYGDKEFLLGYDGAKGEPGGFKQLKANLAAIQSISKQNGVELLLVNYAGNQKFYHNANQKLQLFSTELGIPMVDVQQKVAPLCPRALECEEHFFPDQHPRPKGYRLVAEAVFDYLKK